jgi:hypothetical protein
MSFQTQSHFKMDMPVTGQVLKKLLMYGHKVMAVLETVMTYFRHEGNILVKELSLDLVDQICLDDLKTPEGKLMVSAGQVIDKIVLGLFQNMGKTQMRVCQPLKSLAKYSDVKRQWLYKLATGVMDGRVYLVRSTPLDAGFYQVQEVSSNQMEYQADGYLDSGLEPKIKRQWQLTKEGRLFIARYAWGFGDSEPANLKEAKRTWSKWLWNNRANPVVYFLKYKIQVQEGLAQSIFRAITEADDSQQAIKKAYAVLLRNTEGAELTTEALGQMEDAIEKAERDGWAAPNSTMRMHLGEQKAKIWRNELEFALNAGEETDDEPEAIEDEDEDERMSLLDQVFGHRGHGEVNTMTSKDDMLRHILSLNGKDEETVHNGLMDVVNALTRHSNVSEWTSFPDEKEEEKEQTEKPYPSGSQADYLVHYEHWTRDQKTGEYTERPVIRHEILHKSLFDENTSFDVERETEAIEDFRDWRSHAKMIKLDPDHFVLTLLNVRFLVQFPTKDPENNEDDMTFKQRCIKRWLGQYKGGDYGSRQFEQRTYQPTVVRELVCEILRGFSKRNFTKAKGVQGALKELENKYGIVDQHKLTSGQFVEAHRNGYYGLTELVNECATYTVTQWWKPALVPVGADTDNMPYAI